MYKADSGSGFETGWECEALDVSRGLISRISIPAEVVSRVPVVSVGTERYPQKSCPCLTDVIF
ncbi:MAG: hypothetical protein Kow0059_10620 [Candidatus Sumerlaeia bacterium]